MSRPVFTMMAGAVCGWLAVTVLFSGVTGQQHQHQETVVVNTPHGALRGLRTPVGHGSYVDKFLNIPFAMPPVGYLRFHAPVPNKPWSGTRDATTWGPMCPQDVNPDFEYYIKLSGSEDCLQLNVFTPKPAHGHAGPMPVLVWIHGGGYMIGSGSGWDMSQLAAKGIVVVTINYRLGALGFLSTEDAACPGNNGLLDQIRALEWVRDVISSFNGDPSDVTIAGESAGSSSVSLLTLSSKGRGLFHKAIMESGMALSLWAVGYPHADPEPKRIAWKMASMLGCNGTTDSVDMLACLKIKSVDDVYKTAINITLSDPSGLAFRPVPEASFGQNGMFPATPEVLLREGRVNVTILIGFNKDEGALSANNSTDNGLSKEAFQNVTKVLTTIMNGVHGKAERDRISDRLYKAYAGNMTDPLQLRQASFQMVTDFFYVAPTMKGLELVQHSPNPVTQYMYRFSYRSANRLNKQYQGVVHADELQYVAGSPVSNTFLLKNFVSSWTDDDRLMSEEIMTLWSNFVKYGNPTPNGQMVGGAKWLPWRQDRPQLLDLNVPSSHMMDVPITPSRLHLWYDIIASGEPSDSHVIG